MLVSIIIPAYNMEVYLSQCLDSLLAQSYKNIEIVVVNDGSSDNTEIIALSYKDKFTHFKYIKQPNQGLSSSRNAGLELASGQYLMFLDADDWLDSNCVEETLKTINLTQADVVLFSHINEYENKSIIKEILPNHCHNADDLYEMVYHRLFGVSNSDLSLFLDSERLNTAWGKLYKKDILNGHQFVDTKIIGTEDAWFNIQTLINKKISFCSLTYLHYRRTNAVSITRNYNDQLFERWSTLYLYIENFINENDFPPIYKEALNNRIILNILSLLINIVNSNLPYHKKRRELKEILSNQLYSLGFKKFDFGKIPLQWRLFYYLCYMKMVDVILLVFSLLWKFRR